MRATLRAVTMVRYSVHEVWRGAATLSTSDIAAAARERAFICVTASVSARDEVSGIGVG